MKFDDLQHRKNVCKINVQLHKITWVRHDIYKTSDIAFMTVYILTSSANNRHVILSGNILVILLIYNTNRTGPKQLPCMTPLIIFTVSDTTSPTWVHCCRSVKKFLIQANKLPVIPNDENRVNNFLWETESKAFWKSIYATATEWR